MPDLAPGIAAGGSVGLFVVVAGLLIRLLQVQSRDSRRNEDDIRDLKAENTWCNKRVSILIFACQQGGIAIPQEVWDGPPEVVRDSGDARARGSGRAARRAARRDPFDLPDDL